MARRHRSVRTLRELQEEAAAAEALGLTPSTPPPRAPREPRATTRAEPSRKSANNQPRLKVVWTVCDVGGRTVATFDYPQKSDAEALAAQLAARGKGQHFVRSEKQPIQPG